MVSAATDTAVRASISTPVTPVQVTAAWISTMQGESDRAKVMSIPVRGRGWHMGISSQLCLAAWMPATWATASTSPFFKVPSLMFCNVSGAMWISPAATARRWVTAFSVTSTILARPCSLKWVNSAMVVILRSDSCFGACRWTVL